MNHAYRLVWNQSTQTYVAAAEGTRARGKSGSKSRAVKAMTAAVLAAVAGTAGALPNGNQTVAGQGNVSTSGSTMTVTQQSQNLSMNWQGFSIANGETVRFQQPNAAAIALNRIIGNDPSSIYGNLQANGQVFLINPNGILFGQGAQVNVGGLVASTLNISDADFAAGKFKFSSTSLSPAGVVNQGSLTANPGGYIALLGGQVSNQGTIQAQLGTVALAAGKAMTLDFGGNKLLNLKIDEGALGALAENKQLIQADGGTVLMTAAARDAVLDTVVNNSGIIEARTLQNQGGTIKLLGDFGGGTVKVSGRLDASAPNGGDGGFIETSGAHVKIADGTQVSTLAANGNTGDWLIDPPDYTIAATGGDISGATLSANLASTNVTLASANGTVNTNGQGNININDAVTWSSNSKLTLNAYNSVNVNAVITASGNTAGVTITPNFGGGSGVGTFNMGTGGKVNLPGTNPSLRIAGNNYTVINSLGTQGSTNGRTLQGMLSAGTGFWALGTDIDASATTAWNGGAGFSPIGSDASNAAYGYFDGLGHTISNLYINRPNTDNVGLFGYTWSGNSDNPSVIRNLNLAGGTIIGQSNVGAVVGMGFYSTITNVHSSATVSGQGWAGSVGGLAGQLYGSVINSYATGNVNGMGDYAGGLVGSIIFGDVSGSYATGNVSGGNYTGGLVGSINTGSVLDSYATGNVSGVSFTGGLIGIGGDLISNAWASGSVSGGSYTGGLAGSTNGTILNAHATGAVTADSGSENVGGLVGGGGAAIVNAYATGNVSVDGGGSIGGLIGTNSGGSVSGVVYATGTVNGGNRVGGLVGWNNGGTVTGAYATGAVSGTSDTGGLVGANDGLVDNSHAGGNVTLANDGYNGGGLVGSNGWGSSGTITGSYATGAVTGGNGPSWNYGVVALGGLVGNNNSSSSIVNSYASGAVAAAGSNVGGLAGESDGYISGSYAVGTVRGQNNIGGLVGSTHGGSIANSYATGAVSGDSSVGGLIGSVDATNVSGVYAAGAVSGNNNVGGLAGWQGGTLTNAYWDTDSSGMTVGTSIGGGTGSGVGLTTAQMMQSGSYTGFDFAGTWFTINGSTRPFLRSEWSNIITNPHQLQMMAMNLSANYMLANDIDMAAYTAGGVGFAPVGTFGSFSSSFSGTLDGKGYLISNLRINRPTSSYVGLFGYLWGKVSNLGLVDADITGLNSVGAIAGSVAGTLSSVFATGSVHAAPSSGGTLTQYIGGLVGSNGGTIINSFSNVAVSAGAGNSYMLGGLAGYNNGLVSSSYSSGSVVAFGNYVGGLLGSNEGRLFDAYSTASVTGSGLVGGAVGSNLGQIQNVYAAGPVSGQYWVGGLVGYNQSGTVTSGIWNSDTSLQSVGIGDGTSTTGAMAATTAQLQGGSASGGFLATNATGWDFGSVWYAASGQNPILRNSPFVLTVKAANASKIYGDALPNFSASYGNVWAGDDPATFGTFSASTTATALSNVGTYGITGSFSGTPVSRNGRAYTVINDSGTLTITPKTLTYTATVDNKVYDGTTGVNASAIHTGGLVGLVGNQSFDLGLVGAYNNANVANATGVNLTGTLSNGVNGALASNYAFTNTVTAASSITRRALTYTATVDDKVYDGNTSVAGTAIHLGPLSNLVNGESFTLGATGAYNNANVTAASSVNLTATLSSPTGGANANNYTFTNQTSVSSHVTARPLTVTATKTYDGNTNVSAANLTVSGYVSGQSLNVTLGAGSAFNDADVLDANKVTPTSLTLTTKTGGGGGNASNYSWSSTGPITATITAKNINVTATASKTYDGDTSASGVTYNFSGLVTGQTLNGSATNVTYSSADAGTRNLNVTGFTAQDGSGSASNYNVTAVVGTNRGTISKKQLSYTATVDDKVYDGTTSVDASAIHLGTLTGLVSGQSFLLGATGVYNNANVTAVTGVNLTGSLSGASGGANANNYTLVNPATVSSHITPKTLNYTASTTSNGREYNGTTSASVSVTGLSGMVAGQTLGSSATGSFNDKDVLDANQINVTVTLSSGSGNASNYRVNTTAINASITPRTLTYTAGTTSNGREYDGTTGASVSIAGLTNVVAGENLGTSATGSFNDKNVVGASQINVTGTLLAGTGAGAGAASNYRLNTGTTAINASITPRTVTYTAGTTSSGREYDGTTGANVGITGLNGLIGTETLAGSATGSFNDKNVVGASSINVSAAIADGSGANGGAASNYRLNTNTTAINASITPRTLTYTAGTTSNGREYDGTTDANVSIAGLANLVAGENLGSSATGSFNDRNVVGASSINVTGALLDGTGANAGLASNYRLNTNTTAINASIAPRTLTYTAGTTSSGREYDGTTDANVSIAGLTNLVLGENLGTSATGSFNDRNVVGASSINVTGALADGTGANAGLASNYRLNTNTTAINASITPRELSYTASVDNKTYDGTTGVAAGAIHVNLSGLVGSEALNVSAAGTYNDANVLNASAASLNLTLADGVGGIATNYRVNGTSVSAAIDRAALGVSANAQGKVYGTSDQTLTYAVSGLVNGEQAGAVLSGALTRVAGETVLGGPYAISQGNLASNSNYALSYTGNDYTITPATVLVSGILANNKTYDANTGAVLNMGSALLTGRVGSDSLGISATGAFADANAANGKTVNLSSLTLTGADASNYVLATSGQQSSATADITPRTVTVTVNNATRDAGSANPSFSANYSGFAPGENIAQLDQQATLSTLANTGSAAGTYAINAAGAFDPNYVFVYMPGTLTVQALPQTPGQGAGQTPGTSQVPSTGNPAYTGALAGLGQPGGMPTDIGFGSPFAFVSLGSAPPPGQPLVDTNEVKDRQGSSKGGYNLKIESTGIRLPDGLDAE